MAKKLKLFARYLVLVLVALVLGVNVYLWNARSLMGNALPMPFGYGAAVVLSGSMEPTFSTGDLILVKQQESYALDDIVVYQNGNMLVVHRIVAMDDNTVTTRGDANNTDDGAVAKTAIKGRVLTWIPGVGHAVRFLKTPLGIFCTLGLAVALVELPRLQEQKRDREEREKLLEEIIRLKKEQLEE